MAFITTESIPKSIPKHKRARLINLQRQKIMRQLKTLHFVWECQTLEYVTPFNSKMEQGVMTPAFVEQINKIEIPWLVMGYILSRESNGKNKLTPIEIRITTPCKHCEISGFVADTIMSDVEDFLAKPYGDTFITAGWIASHINTEQTEEYAYQVFDTIGAWKLPSDREESQDDSQNLQLAD